MYASVRMLGRLPTAGMAPISSSDGCVDAEAIPASSRRLRCVTEASDLVMKSGRPGREATSPDVRGLGLFFNAGAKQECPESVTC